MKNYIRKILNGALREGSISTTVNLNEVNNLIQNKRASKNKNKYMQAAESEIQEIINKWIEFQDMKAKKEADYLELKNLVNTTLIQNIESRVGNSILKPTIRNLEQNLFNDYNKVQNRQKIYQIIKELRSEYRNSGWEYYIVSGSVISNDGQEVRNDGWMLTRDRNKISEYLNTNIEKAITMKQNFQNMKENFESSQDI